MFEGLTVKVIIPVLNEAASIGLVLAAIPDWVDEVIVVDNGSTDRTGELARRSGARVINQPARGYGRACLAGMAAVGFCDIVVFLDGDFSDYPDQMDRLVEPIAGGRADMVIGSRTIVRENLSALTIPQRFGTALACKLIGLFWRARPSDLGPFRALRWSSLRGLGMTDPTYGWTVEMQIKAARSQLRVLEVPVAYRNRIGKSKISGTVRGVIGASWKILFTIGRHVCCPWPLSGVGRDRLVVFTRFPAVGATKTRLIPAIGPIAAASLQSYMTRHTLTTARQACGLTRASLEVHYHGGDDRKMRRWLGGGISLRPQSGGDLGARMKRTFNDAFARGAERVLIIGADCLEISQQDICSALDALESCDLVYGPSSDGGYWLIGLRRPADVFSGVGWGGDTVLAETLELAQREHLSVTALDTRCDIDCPEDLAALPAKAKSVIDSPFLSVVIPALNEAGSIQAAIASASGDGVEVIVADGGSSDQTRLLAAQAGARVIHCRQGRARQMNAGAATATGQVLLFLHADTILPAGYSQMVFDALLARQVVGGAFNHKTDTDSAGMAMLRWVVNLRSRYLHLPYGDQALFVRRSVFEAIGGFPDVPITEDFLFVRSLAARGRTVLLNAEAITSARRWKQVGVIRTTAINHIMLAGCLLGVSPHILAAVHKRLSGQTSKC